MSEATAVTVDFDQAFVEEDGCRRWLQTVPLTNLPKAIEAIEAQLTRLRDESLPPVARLKLAELLREPLMFLHTELARRYGGKQLPHAERESESANAAMRLWELLWQLYSKCLKSLIDGNSDIRAAAATLLQRALFAGKQLIISYGLARRSLPATFWRELHAYYRFSEIMDCTSIAVDDPYMADSAGVSCYSTYSHVLLLALADPYSLSVRELELTDRWLKVWARKIFPHVSPPSPSGPLLVVDFESAGGFAVIALAPATVPSTARFGHTAKLVNSVKGRVKKLLQGTSPAELKLGDDVAADTCVNLLKHLYARWCIVPTPTSVDTVESYIQLCSGGLAAAYYRIGGRTFNTQDVRTRFSFYGTQHMSTLDAVSHYDRGREEAERSWPWETWQGVCGSTQAAARRVGGARHRWQLDQLVACKDEDRIFCGYVTRVIETAAAESDELGLSLRLTFWNAPLEALSLRSADALIKEDPPFPAMMIQALGGEPVTLLVPPRVFSPGRKLRTSGGPERIFKLGKLVQRGADFERCTFEFA